MPSPLALKVMGITQWQYNGLSPEEKQRFQEESRQRLIELHETDIAAYTQLTNDVEADINAEASENRTKRKHKR